MSGPVRRGAKNAAPFARSGSTGYKAATPPATPSDPRSEKHCRITCATSPGHRCAMDPPAFWIQLIFRQVLLARLFSGMACRQTLPPRPAARWHGRGAGHIALCPRRFPRTWPGTQPSTWSSTWPGIWAGANWARRRLSFRSSGAAAAGPGVRAFPSSARAAFRARPRGLRAYRLRPRAGWRFAFAHRWQGCG